MGMDEGKELLFWSCLESVVLLVCGPFFGQLCQRSTVFEVVQRGMVGLQVEEDYRVILEPAETLALGHVPANSVVLLKVLSWSRSVPLS